MNNIQHKRMEPKHFKYIYKITYCKLHSCIGLIYCNDCILVSFIGLLFFSFVVLLAYFDLISMFQNPDYDGGANGFPNDIAVLELKSPLEFGSKIDKIDMADSDTGDFAGDKCDLSGWGRIVGGQYLITYI